jgi:uncharacterized protein YndB with AHSA1/START domain
MLQAEASSIDLNASVRRCATWVVSTRACEPAKVYNAITEGEGIAGWWTPQAKAQPKVGSVAEMSFGGGRFVIHMEITKLEPGRTVRWTVQDGLPDWSGTHVTWDLTPMDNRTKVRFGHRDFTSAEGSLAGASYNWAWYLTSLKDYLETGTGRPGQAPV